MNNKIHNKNKIIKKEIKENPIIFGMPFDMWKKFYKLNPAIGFQNEEIDGEGLKYHGHCFWKNKTILNL